MYSMGSVLLRYARRLGLAVSQRTPVADERALPLVPVSGDLRYWQHVVPKRT